MAIAWTNIFIFTGRLAVFAVFGVLILFLPSSASFGLFLFRLRLYNRNCGLIPLSVYQPYPHK